MAFQAVRHRAFPSAWCWLIAAAFLVGGCEKKADPATSARTFFDQIAAGNVKQAYEGTAFGFQAGLNEKAFETVLRDLGLLDYASFRCDPPKIEGNSATLRLEITTKAGKQLPLIVTMTDESGAWRIFSIRSPRNPETGLAENHFTMFGKSSQPLGSGDRPAPDEKEVRRLVRESLLAFDQAVASASFKDFYEIVAEKWKEQLTQGQLERAFHPFVEQQFRVAGIKDVEAVFDRPPAVDGEGLLLVSGYYPTQPYRTVFAMKYYYELPKWRLFGIDVNLQK